MTVVVKKYGRWDEDCCWQLEEVYEKELGVVLDKEYADMIGFKFSERYKEAYCVSVNKLRMTVIREKA